MDDQQDAEHDADACVKSDPTMQPGVCHPLCVELQSLFDG
jgi:hypothetical protein